MLSAEFYQLQFQAHWQTAQQHCQINPVSLQCCHARLFRTNQQWPSRDCDLNQCPFLASPSHTDCRVVTQSLCSSHPPPCFPPGVLFAPLSSEGSSTFSQAPVGSIKEAVEGQNRYDRRQGSQKGIQNFIAKKKSNVVLKQKSNSISFPPIWMATKIDSTQIHKAS